MIYLTLKQITLLFHSPASNCFSPYPLPSKNETEAWTLPFTVFVGLNLDFYRILNFLYVLFEGHPIYNLSQYEIDEYLEKKEIELNISPLEQKWKYVIGLGQRR